MPVDTDKIQEILEAVYAEGRDSLYEHECYRLLEATGAEAAPASRLIPAGQRPTAADLDHLSGDKVVLKVVSPDITHKTEAKGVRIVARELGAVEAAFDLMLREVPESYAAYLEKHEGEAPPALAGRRGHSLEQRLSDRIVGILLCSFMPTDANVQLGFGPPLGVHGPFDIQRQRLKLVDEVVGAERRSHVDEQDPLATIDRDGGGAPPFRLL